MDAPIGSSWNAWHETIGGAMILHVHGEIDLATAPKFERVLADLSPGDPVIIDFTQVEYLDLAGVRALEGFSERVSATRSVMILGPVLHVRRVLDLVDLGRRIRIVDTLAEALSVLQIAPPAESAD